MGCLASQLPGSTRGRWGYRGGGVLGYHNLEAWVSGVTQATSCHIGKEAPTIRNYSHELVSEEGAPPYLRTSQLEDSNCLSIHVEPRLVGRQPSLPKTQDLPKLHVFHQAIRSSDCEPRRTSAIPCGKQMPRRNHTVRPPRDCGTNGHPWACGPSSFGMSNLPCRHGNLVP